MSTNIQANLTLNTAQAQASFNSFAASIGSAKFAQPLGRISGDAAEFTKSLSAATARVTAFGLTAGAIYKVSQAIREGARATVEVDKQLIELNTYIGKSRDELEAFSQSLFKVAKNSAVPFAAAAEAAKEFARQGLSSNEILKRTGSALTLARIAGISYTQAVTGITTAINSFNKEALSTEDIVNKLIAVDTRFAVSSAQLNEALSRVGSSAEESGISIDKLIATVTAAQQITGRGGAVIGNALKTIFTRLQRPEVLTQLEQLGVAVKDQSGYLLDGISILKNYADATKNLSQTEKARTAELVGGIYQINQVNALIKDLSSSNSIYADALRVSNSATDEAKKKNEELNKSLSAVLQQTKTSAQEAASALGAPLLGPLVKLASTASETLLKLVNPNSDLLGQGEDSGKKFASGILKGAASILGKTLAAGGLPILAATGGLLAAKYLKFGVSSLKQLGKASTEMFTSEKELQIQKRINDTLRQNPAIVDNVISRKMNLVQAEAEVLRLIQQQNTSLLTQSRITGRVSSTVTSAQKTAKKGFRIFAEGYIPDTGVAEAAATLEENTARQMGAVNPKARVIQATIQGKTGPIIVNDQETVIPNYANGETAIIPNYRKLDEIPRMAKGYVPNFAWSKSNQMPKDFLIKYPESKAAIKAGRMYSPEVRAMLGKLQTGEKIDRDLLDSLIERDIPIREVAPPSSVKDLPSKALIKNALDKEQAKRASKLSELPAGSEITVRQDVPSMTRKGVGVVKTESSGGFKSYDSFVAFDNPVMSNSPGLQRASLAIGAGKQKTPLLKISGTLSKDQSLPKDLEKWTQTGFNPDRHSYYYDRKTKKPVVGGQQAIQIGNTVFVKEAIHGNREDFSYAKGYVPNFALSYKLPPEPFSAEIPENFIRLIHQTSEKNLRSIKRSGITFDKAKGIEGPRGIYADEKGFYGSPETRPSVEFAVDKNRFSYPPFVLGGDVKPSEIIGIHKPWHRHARYIENNPRVLKATLAGEHDDLTGDTGKAVRFVKRKHKYSNLSSIGAKASGYVPNFAKGIHINDKTQDFTGEILKKEKVIETRDSVKSLNPYVGKRVGLIRTGVGDATLVGHANIGNPIKYETAEQFRADYSKHKVKEGSKYDFANSKYGVKYGFPLSEVTPTKNIKITSRGSYVARDIPDFASGYIPNFAKRKDVIQRIGKKEIFARFQKHFEKGKDYQRFYEIHAEEYAKKGLSEEERRIHANITSAISPRLADYIAAQFSGPIFNRFMETRSTNVDDYLDLPPAKKVSKHETLGGTGDMGRKGEIADSGNIRDRDDVRRAGLSKALKGLDLGSHDTAKTRHYARAILQDKTAFPIDTNVIQAILGGKTPTPNEAAKLISLANEFATLNKIETGASGLQAAIFKSNSKFAEQYSPDTVRSALSGIKGRAGGYVPNFANINAEKLILGGRGNNLLLTSPYDSLKTNLDPSSQVSGGIGYGLKFPDRSYASTARSSGVDAMQALHDYAKKQGGRAYFAPHVPAGAISKYGADEGGMNMRNIFFLQQLVSKNQKDFPRSFVSSVLSINPANASLKGTGSLYDEARNHLRRRGFSSKAIGKKFREGASGLHDEMVEKYADAGKNKYSISGIVSRVSDVGGSVIAPSSGHALYPKSTYADAQFSSAQGIDITHEIEKLTGVKVTGTTKQKYSPSGKPMNRPDPAGTSYQPTSSFLPYGVRFDKGDPISQMFGGLAEGYVPNFALGQKHLNPDGKRHSRKLARSSEEVSAMSKAFKSLNLERKNNKISIFKSEYSHWSGKNQSIGLEKPYRGLSSRAKQIEILAAYAHEMGHSSQLSGLERLRGAHSEIFNKHYTSEGVGEGYHREFDLLKEQDAWKEGLRFIPRQFQSAYKTQANRFYKTYSPDGKPMFDAFGAPGYASGYVPNFAGAGLGSPLLKSLQSTLKMLKLGNVVVADPQQLRNNYGYDNVDGLEGLYDPESSGIVLNESLLTNNPVKTAGVMTHEGLHRLVRLTDEGTVDKFYRERMARPKGSEKIPIPILLQQRLANRSMVFENTASTEDKNFFPSYQRVAAQIPGAYTNADILEEMIADGSLASPEGRARLSGPLGLSEKKLTQVNRLYQKLFHASVRGVYGNKRLRKPNDDSSAPSASLASGYVPNFAGAGLGSSLLRSVKSTLERLKSGNVVVTDSEQLENFYGKRYNRVRGLYDGEIDEIILNKTVGTNSESDTARLMAHEGLHRVIDRLDRENNKKLSFEDQFLMATGQAENAGLRPTVRKKLADASIAFADAASTEDKNYFPSYQRVASLPGSYTKGDILEEMLADGSLVNIKGRQILSGPLGLSVEKLRSVHRLHEELVHASKLGLSKNKSLRNLSYREPKVYDPAADANVPLLSSGYIPNFSGLSDAVSREKTMSGLPVSQIMAHFDRGGNPVAVTNKRDEPNGLKDVPNFALPSRQLVSILSKLGLLKGRNNLANPISAGVESFQGTFATSILDQLAESELISSKVSTAANVAVPSIYGLRNIGKGIFGKGSKLQKGIAIASGSAQLGVGAVSAFQGGSDLNNRINTKKYEEALDRSKKTFQNLTENTLELSNTLSKLDEAYRDPKADPKQILKLASNMQDLLSKVKTSNPGLVSKLASESSLAGQQAILEENTKESQRVLSLTTEALKFSSKGPILGKDAPKELDSFFRSVINSGNKDLLKQDLSKAGPENFSEILSKGGLNIQELSNVFRTDDLKKSFLDAIKLTQALNEITSGQERAIIDVSKPLTRKKQEAEDSRAVRASISKAFEDQLPELASFAGGFSKRAGISASSDASLAIQTTQSSVSFQNSLLAQLFDKEFTKGLPSEVQAKLNAIETPSAATGRDLESIKQLPGLSKAQVAGIEKLIGFNAQQTREIQKAGTIANETKNIQLKFLALQEKLAFGGDIKTSINPQMRAESMSAGLRGPLTYQLGTLFGSRRTQLGGTTDFLTETMQKYPGLLQTKGGKEPGDISAVKRELTGLNAMDMQKDLLKRSNMAQMMGLGQTSGLLRNKAFDSKYLFESAGLKADALFGSPEVPEEVKRSMQDYEKFGVQSAKQAKADDSALKQVEDLLVPIKQQITEQATATAQGLVSGFEASLKSTFGDKGITANVVNLYGAAVRDKTSEAGPAQAPNNTEGGPPPGVPSSANRLTKYSGSIADAVNRERTALASRGIIGVPNFAMAGINLERSPDLVNASNPHGFGVTNSIDEKNGLRSLGMRSSGYVPNFALKDVQKVAEGIKDVVKGYSDIEKDDDSKGAASVVKGASGLIAPISEAFKLIKKQVPILSAIDPLMQAGQLSSEGNYAGGVAKAIEGAAAVASTLEKTSSGFQMGLKATASANVGSLGQYGGKLSGAASAAGLIAEIATSKNNAIAEDASDIIFGKKTDGKTNALGAGVNAAGLGLTAASGPFGLGVATATLGYRTGNVIENKLGIGDKLGEAYAGGAASAIARNADKATAGLSSKEASASGLAEMRKAQLMQQSDMLNKTAGYPEVNRFAILARSKNAEDRKRESQNLIAGSAGAFIPNYAKKTGPNDFGKSIPPNSGVYSAGIKEETILPPKPGLFSAGPRELTNEEILARTIKEAEESKAAKLAQRRATKATRPAGPNTITGPNDFGKSTPPKFGVYSAGIKEETILPPKPGLFSAGPRELTNEEILARTIKEGKESKAAALAQRQGLIELERSTRPAGPNPIFARTVKESRLDEIGAARYAQRKAELSKLASPIFDIALDPVKIETLSAADLQNRLKISKQPVNTAQSALSKILAGIGRNSSVAEKLQTMGPGIVNDNLNTLIKKTGDQVSGASEIRGMGPNARTAILGSSQFEKATKEYFEKTAVKRAEMKTLAEADAARTVAPRAFSDKGMLASRMAEGGRLEDLYGPNYGPKASAMGNNYKELSKEEVNKILGIKSSEIPKKPSSYLSMGGYGPAVTPTAPPSGGVPPSSNIISPKTSGILNKLKGAGKFGLKGLGVAGSVGFGIGQGLESYSSAKEGEYGKATLAGLSSAASFAGLVKGAGKVAGPAGVVLGGLGDLRSDLTLAEDWSDIFGRKNRTYSVGPDGKTKEDVESIGAGDVIGTVISALASAPVTVGLLGYRTGNILENKAGLGRKLGDLAAGSRTSRASYEAGIRPKGGTTVNEAVKANQLASKKSELVGQINNLNQIAGNPLISRDFQVSASIRGQEFEETERTKELAKELEKQGKANIARIISRGNAIRDAETARLNKESSEQEEARSSKLRKSFLESFDKNAEANGYTTTRDKANYLLEQEGQYGLGSFKPTDFKDPGFAKSFDIYKTAKEKEAAREANRVIPKSVIEFRDRPMPSFPQDVLEEATRTGRSAERVIQDRAEANTRAGATSQGMSMPEVNTQMSRDYTADTGLPSFPKDVLEEAMRRRVPAEQVMQERAGGKVPNFAAMSNNMMSSGDVYSRMRSSAPRNFAPSYAQGSVPNFAAGDFTNAVTEALKTGITSAFPGGGGSSSNVSNSNVINIDGRSSIQNAPDEAMQGIISILFDKIPELKKLGPAALNFKK